MNPFRLPAMLFSILLFMCQLQAQQRMVSSFVRPQSPTVSQLYEILPADTSTVLVPMRIEEKSGTLAMCLSAILPGAGQVYVERYYTIPVIWGVGGYFASQWVTADKRYRDYRDRFSRSVAADSLSHQGEANLKRIRDEYHDIRDEFAIYIGLTYILNIVDAYVGASLYGFDVSDDLGAARLRVRIPLH
jgi:hypothetical protein